MNVPKAIELALADVYRAHGALPPEVMLRCWQTVDADPKWDTKVDRYFPMIDLRCSPGVMDNTERTLAAACGIICATKVPDDPDHKLVSLLYERCEQALYRLYGQWVRQESGPELTVFTQAMGSRVAPAQFVFGGFTITEGLAPTEDEGVNMIGLSLTTHYTREDM